MCKAIPKNSTRRGNVQQKTRVGSWGNVEGEARATDLSHITTSFLGGAVGNAKQALFDSAHGIVGQPRSPHLSSSPELQPVVRPNSAVQVSFIVLAKLPSIVVSGGSSTCSFTFEAGPRSLAPDYGRLHLSQLFVLVVGALLKALGSPASCSNTRSWRYFDGGPSRLGSQRRGWCSKYS